VLTSVSELFLIAIEHNPGFADMLRSHRSEIKKAKSVVDLIHAQKGLQTSGVIAGIRMLESHGKILKSDLVSLGEDKSAIRRFL
jgi:hypothetical protein